MAGHCPKGQKFLSGDLFPRKKRKRKQLSSPARLNPEQTEALSFVVDSPIENGVVTEDQSSD